MKNKITLLLLYILLFSGTAYSKELNYKSPSLEIKQITKNIFIHKSFLNIPNYGKFTCNGMIYKSKNKVVIFDTPTNDKVSQELAYWIDDNLKSKIEAIVINHFHTDAIGGLGFFHKIKVKSYANNRTIKLAKKNKKIIPKFGFDKSQEIKIGDKKVINSFIGEGHTKDNIISYIPSEKTIFGGCLIKSVNANKGNLSDANVSEWAKTIKKIKQKYNYLNLVIPGHGKEGDIELLDYTINLFSNIK